MIPEKLENHIFQYLDEIFVDTLKWYGTILKRDKKLLCGDEVLLVINTDSDFIKIESKHLERMSSWFGIRDFNQYRGVFIRWLLKKFNVPSIHELKLDAINKTTSNKFG
jgi:hypothetical protein